MTTLYHFPPPSAAAYTHWKRHLLFYWPQSSLLVTFFDLNFRFGTSICARPFLFSTIPWKVAELEIENRVFPLLSSLVKSTYYFYLSLADLDSNQVYWSETRWIHQDVVVVSLLKSNYLAHNFSKRSANQLQNPNLSLTFPLARQLYLLPHRRSTWLSC